MNRSRRPSPDRCLQCGERDAPRSLVYVIVGEDEEAYHPVCLVHDTVQG